MRYLEKQIYMETLHLPSVQVWLGNELESRGIDSMIYSRHIIQLLQQDEDDVDCPDYFDFKYKTKVNKKGIVKAPKKPEKPSSAGLEKTTDRKKSAAIECLQAVSEEDTGIEVLVEELCTKLKEVCNPTNVDDPEVGQLSSDSCTSTEDTDTSTSSPELEDPAERYYAAFPALLGQEKLDCSEFSSPYNQDSVDVWKKNPITKPVKHSSSTNIDSGNESEKDTAQKASKGTKIAVDIRPGKNKKRKSSRHHGKANHGKQYENRGRFCRFSSWPQDGNYASDSGIDYQSKFSVQKERELCSQVENLLREILLPTSCQYYDDFPGKMERPFFRTAPASLSEERHSPELEEKDFWYTQPFDNLFTTEEETAPSHQRLYKRHSYPSFECFNQLDVRDHPSSTSSPSQKFNDAEDSYVQQEEGQTVDNDDSGLHLILDLVDSHEDQIGEEGSAGFQTPTRDPESDEKILFGLDEISLEKTDQHVIENHLNNDCFGLQSLLIQQEDLENPLVKTESLATPSKKRNPILNPEHSSYFLSSSPWTATKEDFKGDSLVMPTTATEHKSRECASYSASPVETGIFNDQSLEGNDKDEYDGDVSVGEDYFGAESVFPMSLSTLIDSVLKSSRDSTTSTNSSASVSTMTEHVPSTDLVSMEPDEKLTVPDNNSFALLYSDFLQPNTSEVPIPLSSNEMSQTYAWPSGFLFGEDYLVEDDSATCWSMVDSPQLAFGETASQLWDVNYQGKKMNGFSYPWKPFQVLDQTVENSTEMKLVQDFDCGDSETANDLSQNTLIPQITFSLISEEEEGAFMYDNDDDEEANQDTTFTKDCRREIDRSFSLNELSGLRSKTDSATSPQSKSFELVPSEHSAFQDVVPKRIHHAWSEPNLKQYYSENTQNETKLSEDNLPQTPKKKNRDSNSPKEHLYFSPKTHFQPIQTPLEKDDDGASDASSCDLHLRDLFGGYPKTSKTPYQKFQEVCSDSGDESFIPMFKIRKEHDKYIQTGSSATNFPAQDDSEEPLEEKGNICTRCGNAIQVAESDQAADQECICMEFYQNMLEDFDIYSYVDSLTASEQNTPQNVPEEVKNACTDSGYEDFDTGDTSLEGARHVRYAVPERPVEPPDDIPSESLFESITVEKSSGEKEVFSRDDGWVMYKVDGGLGLQCLSEARIRKNLKYAKATDDEDDDDVENGEEFMMHQVEQEWLLNGYCEGDSLDSVDNSGYPISQSTWSTGHEIVGRGVRYEQMDRQYSERGTFEEPYEMKLSSQPVSSSNPFTSFTENNVDRNFVEDSLQSNMSIGYGRECSPKDSSQVDEDLLIYPCSGTLYPDDLRGGGGRATMSQLAPDHEEEDVVTVKLVLHKRKMTQADFIDHDVHPGTELQESFDPLLLMPMPSQAVFSTDLEEEWLKGKHSEKDRLHSATSGKGSAGAKKKPCSFFMEGSCRRVDCKFAHDISNITCRFWEEGDCFKAEMCPFLHGYYPRVTDSTSVGRAKGVKFDYQAEDFPDLRKGEDIKSKTVRSKKIPSVDSRVSQKMCRRVTPAKISDRGLKPLGEKKTPAKNNKTCVYSRKATSSTVDKTKL